MKKTGLTLLLAILSFLCVSCLTFGNDANFYEAIKQIHNNNLEIAYMNLRNLLIENPNSKYAMDSRFAICEYYFENNDRSDAVEELKKFILEYPRNKCAVFAKAMLYKLLLDSGGSSVESLAKIKDAFFSKSVILIFQEAKKRKYASIFGNKYELSEYVDKIVIHKNREILLEIAP